MEILGQALCTNISSARALFMGICSRKNSQPCLSFVTCCTWGSFLVRSGTKAFLPWWIIELQLKRSPEMDCWVSHSLDHCQCFTCNCFFSHCSLYSRWGIFASRAVSKALSHPVRNTENRKISECKMGGCKIVEHDKSACHSCCDLRLLLASKSVSAWTDLTRIKLPVSTPFRRRQHC